MVGDNLIVLPADSPLILNILDVQTLNQRRTVSAVSGISDIETTDRELFLFENGHAQAIDVQTWERKARLSDRHPATPGSLLRRDGLAFNGLLFGFESSAPVKLVYGVHQMPALPTADGSLTNGSFLRPLVGQSAAVEDNMRRHRGDQMLFGNETWVSVSAQVQMSSVGQHVHSARDYVLQLFVRDRLGATLSSPVLERFRIPVGTGITPPVLRVFGSEVFVASQDRLFEWKHTHPLTTAASADPMYFEPKQTRIVLPRTGQTVLHHQLPGTATDPVSVRLISPAPGLTFDAKTRNIIVDCTRILRAAEDHLLRTLGTPRDPAALLQRLTQLKMQLDKAVPERPGESVQGLPVAVPVHLQAIDNDGRIAQLQYFVFADVDPVTLIRRQADASERWANNHSDAAEETIVIGPLQTESMTRTTGSRDESANPPDRDQTGSLIQKIRELQQQKSELQNQISNLQRRAPQKTGSE
ncbi:MAG: hypothetical protein R3C49_11130 [Planctomycetaceae bacterium]